VERLIFLALLAATALTVLAFTLRLHPRRRLEFLREAAVVISAYFLYFLIRSATEGRADEAIARALSLGELEETLGIAVEVEMQALILEREWLVDLANGIYIGLHWPLIAAIALWLYHDHTKRYFTYRNAVLVSGAMGLIVFATLPMAPPRLADPEFIDTVVERSNAYRVMQPPGLTNQYAAMPSLHLGWNLLMSIALIRESRHVALQIVGYGTPVLMFLAMVMTANHYVLDGVVGVAVVIAALLAVERLFPWVSAWRAAGQRVTPP
jgi:PAP2 superfamily protein